MSSSNASAQRTAPGLRDRPPQRLWTGWRGLVVALAFAAPYAVFWIRLAHERDPGDPLMTPATLAVRLVVVGLFAVALACYAASRLRAAAMRPGQRR